LSGTNLVTRFIADPGVNPYDGGKLKTFDEFVHKELVRRPAADIPITSTRMEERA
jgi:predicted 2-oxoglutarate/Fe(II)-dependent dioxygenase YbiX